MPTPSVYRFDSVFSPGPIPGSYITRYNITVNGVYFNQGSLILSTTAFGGLNILNYVGRDIIGTYNQPTGTVTILGFR
jgi:hypothetical protein